MTIKATAAAKATQPEEEKERLESERKARRAENASPPIAPDPISLTAPKGSSTNRRKGSHPSQMGSLSLIAGFRENSLTSIFKMSHAQVKQTKQSTPHAMRRASTILSAVSSEIFSMSALFISALSSAAASSAAAESSEAAAFADKSVPAEREASFSDSETRKN